VTTTSRPHEARVRRGMRTGGWCLLALVALSLTNCATSSSTDQLPIGGKPSVTVLLRVRSDDGPQVQLLASGVDQATLDLAASAVAAAVFPSGQAGAPQAIGTTTEGLTSAAVPITLSDEAMSFSVTSDQMTTALSELRPKALGVWACTDGRRTLEVVNHAPGAVPSDVASGSCKIAGSSVAHDGVTWTATVTLGAVQPPSLLPVAIGTSVVLALIALGIALLRGRAAARDTSRSAAPPEASVH
jgi:hypothetical protein